MDRRPQAERVDQVVDLLAILSLRRQSRAREDHLELSAGSLAQKRTGSHEVLDALRGIPVGNQTEPYRARPCLPSRRGEGLELLDLHGCVDDMMLGPGWRIVADRVLGWLTERGL